MAKDTSGKKGHNVEKNKNNGADSLAEANDGKIEVSTASEEGIKISREDRKKKKKYKEKWRHEGSDSGTEFFASGGSWDNNGRASHKKKRRFTELNEDVEESQKSKKGKQKRLDGIVRDTKEALQETPAGVEESMNRLKKDMSNNFELEDKKERKKRHKVNANRNGTDSFSVLTDDDNMEGVLKEQVMPEKEGTSNCFDSDQKAKKKEKNKKKEQKRDTEGDNVALLKNSSDGEGVRFQRDQCDEKTEEKAENSRRKRKRKKKHLDDDTGVLEMYNASCGIEIEENEGNERNRNSNRNGPGVHAGGENNVNEKKKKDKSGEGFSGKEDRKRVTRKKNKVKTSDPSEKSTRKDRSKRVAFSDHVEVFPLPSGPSDSTNSQDEGFVCGKRFSQEEDVMVKEAVFDYIKAHGLDEEEGLHKVLNCKSYPEVKNCWKEIAAALPWRPAVSIYYRAHSLFERSENRTWRPEEFEMVRKFHEKNGPDWKKLADEMGKHRIHINDTWRRIKSPNMKKGHWSQEEYQNLFDLVNTDLRMKAFEEKQTKHGMLRDNISWTAIGEKLSTRSDALCCMKWYDRLTSSLVAAGEWADADDYRLLGALLDLDASCMEDVDWDTLLEHRCGDICRKRWSQMGRHIGEHGVKSFSEQVEVLSKRYCPDLLDVREAYYSKPAVS